MQYFHRYTLDQECIGRWRNVRSFQRLKIGNGHIRNDLLSIYWLLHCWEHLSDFFPYFQCKFLLGEGIRIKISLHDRILCGFNNLVGQEPETEQQCQHRMEKK